MLILSKFKDYYDSAVGLGIDKSIVYDRKTESIENFDVYDNIFGKRKYWYRPHRVFDLNIIGFCGKLYPFLVIEEEIDMYEKKYHFEFDKNNVKEHLNLKTKKKYSWEKETVQNFNNVWEKIINFDSVDIHRESNSPIFIITDSPIIANVRYEYNFTINPRLKDWDFVKVIDPYSAFQEIQMYISGVLASGDNIEEIEMSEKDKINQHGFDEKYGFRKRPKK